VLLLIAGAGRWVVSTAHPEASSTLASEAIGCAWAALLSLTFLFRKSAPHPQRSRSSFARCLLAGAMLFAGPAVALLIRGRELDSASLTLALALTPIVIAIAAAALGTETSDGIAGRIWPALAALAGLLLLLAQPTLGDARTDLALILAPALTGVGAALFCLEPSIDNARLSFQTTSSLLGASILFALALAETYFVSATPVSLSLLAIASDGLLALLGILALARLGATRWSSQFTWIPLLIVVQGIALVRPQLTAHSIIGLLLLTVASIYLLVPAPTDAIPETSTAHG
jgi:drug/metabolite transporter (DMT)-like permease